ncbi:TonB-dependent siderophore receptor [Altererythrobacter sp.]|uniref:TonB-dependent receptor n=1 Tax=Altererythrobacter sp. TaxID=1872480 RepID=UPI001B2C02AB|nr:TonB-dependent siderophore receptor [Altererythrobacter sp.]MBO6609276.1 TonB-dependent siderophore receptor [Altererythrobacter sp.]MBO6640723.1 TonB-dependent siderophore receptor [Altererythrobacter sp.]MBO6708579.1 TonB-dependent siderophore receptor [Altererythrobacter sp.]
MHFLTKAMLLSGSATLMPAASAIAANADSSEVQGLAPDSDKNEIIVMGTILQSNEVNSVKTPTPIIDVPQSLTITTEDNILDRGFTSIGQIVDYTPGVNTSQGEGHRDSIVFRGVRSTADFFIDGMRDDVQYYRSLYNLDQVEILRGPNALLFGRGGTGGILNRVTKKGIVGGTFGGGQIAIDTFGEYSVQTDINLSYGDSSAFRLNAMYEQLNNHRDFYDGERIGINPTARFAVGEDTSLDLSYEYVDHYRFIDRGIPTGIDGRPVDEFEEIVFGDPELNFNDLEAHLLRANLQHDFTDNFKGVFSAFYGDYDKVYSNFYVSGYDQANSPDVVTTDGYIDATQRENLILSANFIGEFETGAISHTLLFGAEYINTSSDQDRFNPIWDQTDDDNEVFAIKRPLNLRGGMGINAMGDVTTVDLSTDLNDFTKVDIDVVSLYIQNEVELTDWLHLVVGGRYDGFDIEVNNVPANEIRTRKDEEFSPRGGLIFKPMENLSIYASYSESFLPRSGEQFANINGTNNALDPDKFTNLEAGVKWDFADRLSFTAAVFEIEQSSPQPNDNDPSTLDVIDSKIDGFELQLQGEVMPGWTVSAGYSFLDGEQQSRNGPTGLRPRELPENMFSIWNQVEVTDRFGLGIGLTHQDESFIDNGNDAVLPAYTRIDAAGFFDVSENLRVQVNVENLTDTLYFPNSHATHQASVGAPINARFAITGRF